MANTDLSSATIGQASINVHDVDKAVAFYRDTLGLRFLFQAGPKMAFFDCGGVRLFLSEGDGPAAELHVVVEPDLLPARQGAGGVYHVAFRTPNDKEYDAWARRLLEMGMPTSGPVDRYYFRSLYFREPGGVLFEIATDGPGFATDEKLEDLGKRLALPPFLEPRRKEIEDGLEPLEF